MQSALEILLANTVVALVIACAAVLAGRLFRRPAISHFLWVLVLLKLITPPLFRIPLKEWSVAPPPVAVTPPPPAPQEPVPGVIMESTAGRALPPVEATSTLERCTPAGEPPGNWRQSIAAFLSPSILWLAGSLLAIGLLVLRMGRFHFRLQCAARPDAALLNRVKKLSAEAGMSRSPQVRIMKGKLSPMVWMPGTGATIVLPEGLVSELGEQELEAVLAHEISHLARGDHWVRWIEVLATAVHWWNPVLWWARRELQRHEEECCDFHVMAKFPEQSHSYARALVRTASFLAGGPLRLPPAACGAGHVKALKQRISMMRLHNPHAALTGRSRSCLLSLSLVPLCLSPVRETRAPWMVELPTGYDSNSPRIADIDRDGLPDIVFTNYHSDTLSIYRNTGKGNARQKDSFAPRVDFPTGPNPASLAIGDLDGDGKPDLVVANDYGACISVYRNTSTPGHIDSSSLAPRVNLPAGRHPVSVQVIDVDGDGRRDISVVNAVHGPSTVSVHRNCAHPGMIVESSFEAGVHFPSGEYTFHLETGDLDGDGKPDLIVSNVESKGLAVLRNQCLPGEPLTAASIGEPVFLPTGHRTHHCVVGDLNGDSKPELAALHDGGITVFGNRAVPNGPFGTASFPVTGPAAGGGIPCTVTPGFACEGALADIDHDGRPELMVTSQGQEGVCVFASRPAPEAGMLDRIRLLQGKGIALTVGDLDGDRSLEVLTCVNFVLRIRSAGGSEKNVK